MGGNLKIQNSNFSEDGVCLLLQETGLHPASQEMSGKSHER
jgi:hypothetical protein